MSVSNDSTCVEQDQELPQGQDIEEARRFLQAIDPITENFTFQCFNDKGRDSVYSPKVLNGALEERWNELVRRNNAGQGIYVTVNQTDLKGRKLKNVVAIRCAFQEDDDGFEGDFPLKPNMLIESSPGKFHRYWLPEKPAEGEDALKDATGVQEKMVADYGSDPNAKDITRVLRLPGFFNMKTKYQTPWLVKIVDDEWNVEDSDLHTWDEIKEAFPPPVTVAAESPKSRTTVSKFVTDTTTAALAGECVTEATIADLRSALEALDANDRDLWVAIGHALRALPDNTGWSPFEEWSNTADDEFRSSPEKLRDEWKGFDTNRSGYKSVFTKAREAGWVNPKKGNATADADALFQAASQPVDESKADDGGPQLGASLPPVKPLDYTMLPDGMEWWVRDIAERAHCPPDFIAATAMVAAGSLLGRKVEIYPKAKDNWRVIPNLWGMGISRPSVMKSLALTEGVSPLKPLVDAAEVQFKLELNNNEVNKLFAKAQTEVDSAAVKKAVKDGDLSAINILKSTMQIAQEAEDAEPHEQRYILNDATVEKLGELLNQNPNGFLVLRDELSGLLQSLDREDRSNDRAFYLECFGGAGSYTYDRIGRGTIHIKSTTLSIIGGIQPSKIAPYIHHAITQGAGDDGLIQRFQLAVWPDDIKAWRNIDRVPDKAAQARVFKMFKKLDDMDAVEDAVRFTPMAQVLFNKWREKLEKMVRKPSIHPALEAHFIKYRSLMPSLALIINEMDVGHGKPVTLGSAAKAVKWCIYLKSHAERMYGSAINISAQNAETILTRRKKIPDEFTVRDVRRKHWAGLSDNEQVVAALLELAECGYIRAVEPDKTKKAGRPTDKYTWIVGAENE